MANIARDIAIKGGSSIPDDEQEDLIMHMVKLHNHIVYSEGYGRPAVEKHTGDTADISHLNSFYYGEKVEIWRPEKRGAKCSVLNWSKPFNTNFFFSFFPPPPVPKKTVLKLYVILPS